MTKTIEEKTRFVELRAKGYSYDKIGGELKISKQTLVDWQKELQEEIHNMRSVEYEALCEKHYHTHKARIELYGSLVEKLKHEIEKRDISDIPTDKLFTMLIKLIGIKATDPNSFTLITKATLDWDIMPKDALYEL